MILCVCLASFGHGHRVGTGRVNRRGDLDVDLAGCDDISTPSDGRIGVVLPGRNGDIDGRQEGVAGARERGGSFVHAVGVGCGAAALQTGIQMDV